PSCSYIQNALDQGVSLSYGRSPLHVQPRRALVNQTDVPSRRRRRDRLGSRVFSSPVWIPGSITSRRRLPPMAHPVFTRKPLAKLLEELEGRDRLKRVLGPVGLTSMGIGAVIGAGIFVSTGQAAHNTAGPSLMVSYAVSGFVCIFAALCYAEF